ncbi:hypothetical protein GOODEAATRI_001883 [Goodea atripinnis]|uniref:Uncharacterized protein n=1 Tax=Goodea atripinnis TaxID=208336 RepID=A0ABV0MNK9_9TELE
MFPLVLLRFIFIYVLQVFVAGQSLCHLFGDICKLQSNNAGQNWSRTYNIYMNAATLSVSMTVFCFMWSFLTVVNYKYTGVTTELLKLSEGCQLLKSLSYCSQTIVHLTASS